MTVLVGENGSGKSTLIEAVAMAFGMAGEGGSTGARHRTRASESDLWQHLTLVREAGGSRWGFFVRAETMHGFYSYLEAHTGPRPEPLFHEMSHGESFLALLQSGRFDRPGLYLLDEPESALSFQGCLDLVAQLHRLSRTGGAQILVATHSPLVASIPGAPTSTSSVPGGCGSRRGRTSRSSSTGGRSCGIRRCSCGTWTTEHRRAGHRRPGVTDSATDPPEFPACRRRASTGARRRGTTFGQSPA